MSVHRVAVWCLAALALWFVYGNVVQSLVASYSGAEPAPTAARSTWLWTEAVVAVVAAAVAVATL